ARLPLALTLVAAHAAIRPDAGLRPLADELRHTRHRWRTLAGDDPATAVRAVFSWSYQALAPDAARLFRLLGLHPGADITAPTPAGRHTREAARLPAGHRLVHCRTPGAARRRRPCRRHQPRHPHLATGMGAAGLPRPARALARVDRHRTRRGSRRTAAHRPGRTGTHPPHPRPPVHHAGP